MNSVEKIFQDIRKQVDLAVSSYVLGIIDENEFNTQMRDITYRINKIENALIDVQRQLEKEKQDEVDTYS